MLIRVSSLLDYLRQKTLPVLAKLDQQFDPQENDLWEKGNLLAIISGQIVWKTTDELQQGAFVVVEEETDQAPAYS